MIKIREATQNDKPSLTEMRLALQVHDEAHNPRTWQTTPQGKRRQAEQVDAMLQDPEGSVLIAEENGKSVGFTWGTAIIRPHYTPDRVGSINLIYIIEGYRRRGIGTQLVKALFDHFKTHQVKMITLNYILGNPHAEGFWKKLGFTPVRVSANITPQLLERHLNIHAQENVRARRTDHFK
jgi:ribosomal protein S18 acetylase RimI-like enzyme